MADGAFSGFFTTPEQVLEAERQLRMGQTQQRLGSAYTPALGGAGELGRAVGGAFTRAFGGTTPESQAVQISRARQQALQGVDFTSKEGLIGASRKLIEAGDTAGGYQLAQQAMAIKAPEKEEGFTLSPGQIRFDENNNPVAAGLPQEGKEVNLQPKTFLLTDGSYVSGSYNPKTGERYVQQSGQTVLAPEDAFDVNYRVDKQPKLTLADIKELGDKSATVDSYIDLTNGFKNEYGGYKFAFAGDIVNTSKKIFGDESGQALWWQSQDTMKNKLRHELFGSALTKVEAESFDKITIHPGQHPDVIRSNLNKQMGIAKQAATKLVNAKRATGVPDDQVRAAVGETVWSFIDKPAESTRGGFTKGADGVWRLK